ncbi:MAG: transcription antitermination factor NusB [Gammaproteobacteria bacterium]|nr:transcription antitermination factor NusB [Gammaproteobacteria bacterium]
MTNTEPQQSRKPKPAQRRKARRFVMQSLYQHKISGTSIAEIEQQFLQDHDMRKVDLDYFHDLLMGIADQQANIDAEIQTAIDRDFSELDPVELSILQLGVYELIHRIDVPYRVVINEGVELAKIFGATDGYKYVNSILDILSRKHRSMEHGKS